MSTGRLFLFLISIVCVAAIASAMQITSNYSRQYANQIVSNAISYVNMVNESSYLVFYPNLTQAYAYLNLSLTYYNSSPASAVVFANKAVDQATVQYNILNSYRQISVAVMLVFTAALFLLLQRLMAPVLLKKNAGKR